MGGRGELERRLSDLKGQLAEAEGGPTEVYSRIVGYYRSVRNWNAGKRAEYSGRRTYGLPVLARAAVPAMGTPAAATRAARPGNQGVLVFTRKACPNCPPVSDFVSRSGLRAVFVDVDLAEGLALARRHGVLATPTVVGLDGDGQESFRAFGLAELRKRLPNVELGLC